MLWWLYMCSHPQDFTPELVGTARLQCVSVFECFYLGAIARPQISQLRRSSSNKIINKPHNFLSHFNHIILPCRMLGINRCGLLFSSLLLFLTFPEMMNESISCKQRVFLGGQRPEAAASALKRYSLLCSSSWQWERIPPSSLCCAACGPPSEEGRRYLQVWKDAFF